MIDTSRVEVRFESGNAQDLLQHIYCDREVLESRGALGNTNVKISKDNFD